MQNLMISATFFGAIDGPRDCAAEMGQNRREISASATFFRRKRGEKRVGEGGGSPMEEGGNEYFLEYSEFS